MTTTTTIAAVLVLVVNDDAAVADGFSPTSSDLHSGSCIIMLTAECWMKDEEGVLRPDLLAFSKKRIQPQDQ